MTNPNDYTVKYLAVINDREIYCEKRAYNLKQKKNGRAPYLLLDIMGKEIIKGDPQFLRWYWGPVIGEATLLDALLKLQETEAKNWEFSIFEAKSKLKAYEKARNAALKAIENLIAMQSSDK
jgi:hypothetical protein